jgi:hypothetical protein
VKSVWIRGVEVFHPLLLEHLKLTNFEGGVVSDHGGVMCHGSCVVTGTF